MSWDGDVAAFAFGRGGVVNKDEERREDDWAGKRAFMKMDERQVDNADDDDGFDVIDLILLFLGMVRLS